MNRKTRKQSTQSSYSHLPLNKHQVDCVRLTEENFILETVSFLRQRTIFIINREKKNKTFPFEKHRKIKRPIGRHFNRFHVHKIKLCISYLVRFNRNNDIFFSLSPAFVSFTSQVGEREKEHIRCFVALLSEFLCFSQWVVHHKI